MDNYAADKALAKQIMETPEFKRAYDIHGRYYEGFTVSPEDEQYLRSYIEGLFREHPDGLPFSVSVWCLYASKYV